MEGGGFRQRPFILFAVLQQITFVFFQQEVIQFALFCRGNIVLTQPLENRIDFIQVNGHIFEAFPMVSAPVRHNALSQIRIDLVQQYPQTGNQGLQRVFRVAASLFIP